MAPGHYDNTGICPGPTPVGAEQVLCALPSWWYLHIEVWSSGGLVTSLVTEPAGEVVSSPRGTTSTPLDQARKRFQTRPNVPGEAGWSSPTPGIPDRYTARYTRHMTTHVQFKLTDTEYARLMEQAAEGESAGLVAKRLLLAGLEGVAATRTPAMTLAQNRAAKMAARKEPEVVGPRVDPDDSPVLGARPR